MTSRCLIERRRRVVSRSDQEMQRQRHLLRLRNCNTKATFKGWEHCRLIRRATLNRTKPHIKIQTASLTSVRDSVQRQMRPSASAMTSRCLIERRRRVISRSDREMQWQRHLTRLLSRILWSGRASVRDKSQLSLWNALPLYSQIPARSSSKTHWHICRWC